MTGPPVQGGPQVQQNPGQLQQMNGSAQQNASPVDGGALPCEKKSWFSIRIVDDKNAVIEGLTIKLKVAGLGDVERVTSKASDPVKIDALSPGGTAEVESIESEKLVWEAVGDIS